MITRRCSSEIAFHPIGGGRSARLGAPGGQHARVGFVGGSGDGAREGHRCACARVAGEGQGD